MEFYNESTGITLSQKRLHRVSRVIQKRSKTDLY